MCRTLSHNSKKTGMESIWKKTNNKNTHHKTDKRTHKKVRWTPSPLTHTHAHKVIQIHTHTHTHNLLHHHFHHIFNKENDYELSACKVENRKGNCIFIIIYVCLKYNGFFALITTCHELLNDSKDLARDLL